MAGGVPNPGRFFSLDLKYEFYQNTLMSFYEAKHFLSVSINTINLKNEKLSLLSILLVGIFGFMTSCSSSDDCHECCYSFI